MKEAEAGNFGKALSLLSHAADINAQDYKLFEMIAQVRDWMNEWFSRFTSSREDPSAL